MGRVLGHRRAVLVEQRAVRGRQARAVLEVLHAEGHAGERAGVVAAATASSTASAAWRARSGSSTHEGVQAPRCAAAMASRHSSSTSTAFSSPRRTASAISITVFTVSTLCRSGRGGPGVAEHGGHRARPRRRVGRSGTRWWRRRRAARSRRGRTAQRRERLGALDVDAAVVAVEVRLPVGHRLGECGRVPSAG